MNAHLEQARDRLDEAGRMMARAQVLDGRDQIVALDRMVTAAREAAVAGLGAMADLADAIDPEFAQLCRAHPEYYDWVPALNAAAGIRRQEPGKVA